MLCTPLMDFPFSRDGTAAEAAVTGVDCDIPAALVPGLKAAGFVTEAKAIKAAPENKMMPASENKAEEPAQDDATIKIGDAPQTTETAMDDAKPKASK